MRKISVAMITIMLVMILSLSTLFGCTLITTNSERDMGQEVAFVQIEKDAPKEIIYKKDMVVSYLNYYQYAQQGTDNAEIFKSVIDNLINNRVLVQYAMQHFAKKNNVQENKWELTTYLSDEEEADAINSAMIDMDDFIESYVEDKAGNKVQDSFTAAVREVPTGATNEEKERKIDKIEIESRMNAFVKAINVLQENDLLGNDYKDNDITKTEYYQKTLKGYYEQQLIENLEEDIVRTARSLISYDDVKAEYQRIYEKQKAFSEAEFEGALSSASAASPILFGRSGYGMVYHVLLKADETMTKEFADWKEDNKNASTANINAERARLFEGIKAKDMRSSWITSGYDFAEQAEAPLADYANYKFTFTGDYTLYKNQSLPFFGNLTHLNAAHKEDKDYKAEYRVDDLKEFSLDEMIALINKYLYNGSATMANNDRAQTGLQTYVASELNADFDKRVKELMFAFSQDDSDTALNTYKGYVIKPAPNGSEQDEWMKEFADRGRSIIAGDEKTFEVVATDYGYHIMFFSEKFENYDYPTLEDYLNKEFKMSEGITSWKDELEKIMLADWDEYADKDNYLYILHNNLAATMANADFGERQQQIINEYVNNSECVKTYPERYSDLISE